MLEKNLESVKLERTSIECIAHLLTSGGEIHWADFDCNTRCGSVPGWKFP